MTTPCPLCREAFPAHVAVRARCRARWRGTSFDAQAAKANAGLAVMDVLGSRPRDPDAMRRFVARVRVEAYRATAPGALNPAEAFDPGEGEWWEFHVGFRDDVAPDVVARVAAGVARAIDASRNFSDATPAPANVP